MAEVDNQDILDAIRGRYQGPNLVEDENLRIEVTALQAELQAVKAAIQGILQTSDASAHDKLDQLYARLEAIENRLDNPLPVQLSGSKVTLAAPSTHDTTLNVTAGGVSSVTITPPAGELWRVKFLRILVPAPSGAASGVHAVLVRYGVNQSSYNLLNASSAYGASISFVNNIISTAATKVPASEESQQQAILNLVLSASCPLIVRYENSTDVTQTGSLAIRLIKEVEYIVS